LTKTILPMYGHWQSSLSVAASPKLERAGPRPRHVPTRYLLSISVGISTCALILSLVFLGAVSFWMTPVAFLFTTAYNTTLLILSSKKKSRPAPQATFWDDDSERHKLRVTFKLWAILCTILCAVVWIVAFVILVVITSMLTRNMASQNMSTAHATIPSVEAAFALSEAILHVYIAFRCIRGRRQHFL